MTKDFETASRGRRHRVSKTMTTTAMTLPNDDDDHDETTVPLSLSSSSVAATVATNVAAAKEDGLDVMVLHSSSSESSGDHPDLQVVELELPPGRYSFQLHDYSRYLRQQQQQQSYLKGILKKQSSYGYNSSRSLEAMPSSSSSLVTPSSNSNSHTTQSKRGTSPRNIVTFATSWLKRRPSIVSQKENYHDEAQQQDDEDEGEEKKDDTDDHIIAVAPARTLLSSSSSPTSTSSISMFHENQDLLDELHDLQRQVKQTQKAYKRIKRMRQADDKQLLRLAQELQQMDIQQETAQRSIHSLEETNQDLEMSWKEVQRTLERSGRRDYRKKRSHSWLFPFMRHGRRQRQQQRMLRVVQRDAQRLQSQQEHTLTKLRREQEQECQRLQQELLCATLERDRLFNVLKEQGMAQEEVPRHMLMTTNFMQEVEKERQAGSGDVAADRDGVAKKLNELPIFRRTAVAITLLVPVLAWVLTRL